MVCCGVVELFSFPVCFRTGGRFLLTCAAVVCLLAYGSRRTAARGGNWGNSSSRPVQGEQMLLVYNSGGGVEA